MVLGSDQYMSLTIARLAAWGSPMNDAPKVTSAYSTTILPQPSRPAKFEATACGIKRKG